MSLTKVIAEDPKFDYYKLLNTKKISKGDVRAFIGLRTWLHEKDRLEAGDDKYTAHDVAFGEALKDLKTALESNRFSEEFNKDRNVWDSHECNLPRKPGGRVLLPPPIPKMENWKGNSLTLISLFSGAFGLDLGFLAAGFDLRLANDVDVNSYKTIRHNIPLVPFIHEDFLQVDLDDALDKAGLAVGELDVLTGGPPCQPFSTAGKRMGLNDPRASPLKGFVRAIKKIKPKAFLMEEVTGLKSARLLHVPIAERDNRVFKPEEKKGSAFKVVIKMLESTGYSFIYKVLNAADFGSPQTRNRIIFMGLREGVPEFPVSTHNNKCQVSLSGERPIPWNNFWDATADLQGGEHEFMKLSISRAKYMHLVPPGGHWRHLPKDEIKKAMGGAYSSGGGKMGYYRRLSWAEPSPTVVTSPVQKGTMFCHPEELRPLSLEEYKRIQGFPDDWDIIGNTSTKYRLIGDAVPVHLSYAIAKKVEELLGK